MDWRYLVDLYAEIGDSELLELIPEKLVCGTLPYMKAIEMRHPRLFIVTVFVACSTRVTDLRDILRKASKLLQDISFGLHPEFMLKLSEESPEVQRQFMMLREGIYF